MSNTENLPPIAFDSDREYASAFDLLTRAAAGRLEGTAEASLWLEIINQIETMGEEKGRFTLRLLNDVIEAKGGISLKTTAEIVRMMIDH